MLKGRPGIAQGRAARTLLPMPQRREATVLRALSHKVGLINCTDCHDPHGALGENSLRSAAWQFMVCTKCHGPIAGPFVHVHAAVKAEGCTACHFPTEDRSKAAGPGKCEHDLPAMPLPAANLQSGLPVPAHIQSGRARRVSVVTRAFMAPTSATCSWSRAGKDRALTRQSEIGNVLSDMRDIGPCQITPDKSAWVYEFPGFLDCSQMRRRSRRSDKRMFDRNQTVRPRLALKGIRAMVSVTSGKCSVDNLNVLE